MNKTLMALAMAAAAASAAQAGVVSVNYTADGATPMAGSEVAGVVPAGNWNNFTQSTVAANAALNTNDQTGAVSGVKFSWLGSSMAATTTADASGDSRMMRDGLYGGNIEIRITVPAAMAGNGYKVILYVDPLGGTKQETRIIAKDNAANQTIGTYYVDDAGTDFSGTYVAADGASHLPVTNITTGSNYIVLNGLTTTSLLLTITSPNTTPYRTMISGIQFVTSDYAVPEPASFGLLALTVGGLLWRRK